MGQSWIAWPVGHHGADPVSGDSWAAGTAGDFFVFNSFSSHASHKAKNLACEKRTRGQRVPQERPPFTHLAVTKTERRMDSRAFGNIRRQLSLWSRRWVGTRVPLGPNGGGVLKAARALGTPVHLLRSDVSWGVLGSGTMR